jgi:hypothetical protein
VVYDFSEKSRFNPQVLSSPDLSAVLRQAGVVVPAKQISSCTEKRLARCDQYYQIGGKSTESTATPDLLVRSMLVD